MPYLLSNLLLVTESLTLIAGKRRSPPLASSYRRWTPVVVSSVTPRMPSATRVQRSEEVAREARRAARITRYSWLSPGASLGTAPASSNSRPLCTSSVASPPSSRIRFGPVQSAPTACASVVQSKICWVHHQYSSSVSPFQAKTGTPAGASTVPCGPTAIAAAASSWVEKMLQLAQRTCAPRATSVSMSTAVCTVMCSEPAMRAPFSGCVGPNSSRRAIRPGISFSASRIWCLPASASARSATRNGREVSMADEGMRLFSHARAVELGAARSDAATPAPRGGARSSAKRCRDPSAEGACDRGPEPATEDRACDRGTQRDVP